MPTPYPSARSRKLVESPDVLDTDIKLNVGRNTVILATAMAVYSAVLQLTAAVSSITFVLVTGVRGLLGLGPAIFLVASALTAMPAGRAMDRIGRRPVIACGYLSATAGCCADRPGHATSARRRSSSSGSCSPARRAGSRC